MTPEESAVLQQLFGLMGKMVRLHTDGETVTEGLLKGIQLDGAELITSIGPRKIALDAILRAEEVKAALGVEDTLVLLVRYCHRPVTITCAGEKINGIISSVSADSVEMITADGKFSVGISGIESVEETEILTVTKKDGSFVPTMNALVRAVVYGTPEEVKRVLSDSAAVTELGLSEAAVGDILKKIEQKTISWEHTPFKNAVRCQHVLKTAADSQIMEYLYLEAFKKPDEGKKKTAMAGVMTAMMNQGKCKEIIEFFRSNGGEEDSSPEAMRVYATALAKVEGGEALSKYLEKNPQLTGHSTYSKYFEKLLQSFETEKYDKLREAVAGNVDFPKPNAFEEAVLAANEEAAIAIASDFDEMLCFGYTEQRTEIILQKLSEGVMSGLADKTPKTIGNVFWTLQQNLNHMAERVYLDNLDDAAAVGDLLLLYAGHQEYRRAIAVYESRLAEDYSFEQYCGIFVAYAMQQPQKSVTILAQYPEILADAAVRSCILSAAPDTYDERTIKIAEMWQRNSGSEEGSNAFEKALIKGDAEAISRYASDVTALTEFGYTTEEIEKITAAANSPYTLLENDYSAGVRVRLFLGGRDLLALRYYCRYVIKRNIAEILDLMEKSGLYEWCVMMFASRYEICVEIPECCNVYASSLLHSMPVYDALDEIEGIIDHISDRVLLSQMISKCDTPDLDEMRAKIEEKLNRYDANELENAIIALDQPIIRSLLSDREKLKSLGYTESEIEHFERVYNAMPKGSGGAEIGLRLYHMQQNKNSLAEKYLKPVCGESKNAAKVMFHIYCDEERYDEALEHYDANSAVLENRTEVFAEYLDTLYYTGHYGRFLDVFFNSKSTPARRHSLICARMLAELGDERLDGILQELEKKNYIMQDVRLLSGLVSVMMQKEMYDKTAVLLCNIFAMSSANGVAGVYKSIAAAGELDDADKTRLTDEAVRLGLDMALPAYWIAKGMEYDGGILESWYENAIAEADCDLKKYALLEEMLPERKADIIPRKLRCIILQGESQIAAVQLLQEVYDGKDFAVLAGLLPILSESAAVAEEGTLEIIKKVFDEGYLRAELVDCLTDAAINLKRQDAVPLFRFFAEQLEASDYVAYLKPEKADAFKNGYMLYAGSVGTEAAQRALYEFLYIRTDRDAQLLCYIMIFNRRLWSSFESRRNFELLCESRNEDMTGSALTAAFEMVLESENPEDMQEFLKKWKPFTDRSEDEVRKELSRIIHLGAGRTSDTGSAVCSVIAQYGNPYVWKMLYELYKNKKPVVTGNILYCMARSSHDLQEMRSCAGFARKNGLDLLYIHMVAFEMSDKCTNEKVVRSVCHEITGFCSKGGGAKLSEKSLRKIFAYMTRAVNANERHTVNEILIAASALAMVSGNVELFIGKFAEQLKKNPQQLQGLTLQLYINYPEKQQLADEVRQMLADNVPADFYGRQFILDITENPEKLRTDEIMLTAAKVFLPYGARLNVQKMNDFIFGEFADSAQDGMSRGIQAAELLSGYFPEDGLLYEALYYLRSADTAVRKTEECDSEKIYYSLYRYSNITTAQSENLFVHYVKRMICGIRYLVLAGVEVSHWDAPRAEEEVISFFDSVHTSEECRAELDNFIHLTDMLSHETAQYKTLLFCGMTGNWRPFIREFDGAEDSWRVRGDISDFINNLGRFNFLRSAADIILGGGEWEHIGCLMANEELIQLGAVAVIECDDRLREITSRWTSCTILDKSGAEIMADKLLGIITPQEFAVILPVIRLLVHQTSLMSSLAKISPEYAECAADMIMKSYALVENQLYSKDYRDFLRSLSNMMFDNGMYKAVYPILGLIFDSDAAAERYSSENRCSNITHAVYRQKAKFSGLVFGEPEELSRFQATVEYNKYVNLFAVMLAMPKSSDLALIAPILTPLQKKMCAAVFFVTVNKYEEFEQLALDVLRDNEAMANMLFWYGRIKFREEAMREKCVKYIKDKDSTPPYFIILNAHPSVYRMNIFEILNLPYNLPQRAMPGQKDASQQAIPEQNEMPELDIDLYKNMPFARFVLDGCSSEKAELSFADALERFNESRSIDAGARVMLSEDFDSADSASLASFFVELSMAVYLAARNSAAAEDCIEYVPDILKCVEAVPAVSPETGARLAVIISDVLCDISMLEDIKDLFGSETGRLVSLLSEADSGRDTDVIAVYFNTAARLGAIDPLLKEEDKIEQMERLKVVVTNEMKKYTDDASAQILSNIIYIIDNEEMRHKNTPLLKCVIDSDRVYEGEPVTGYVYNYGLKTADKVTITVTFDDESSYEAHIERIYAEKYAPFGFRLAGAKSGEKHTCSIKLTYLNNESTKIKNCGDTVVEILERKPHALKSLTTTAVSVGDIDSEFVGRNREIKSFENEFYDLYEENGSVVKKVRSPRQVQSMVLSGPKRVGKSSMLHRVEKIILDIPDEWVCVYFDVMSHKDAKGVFVNGFIGGWERSYGKIRDTEEYKAIEAKLPESDITVTELDAYYREFRDKFAPGRKIMCIIDEIEGAINGLTKKVLFDMLQYISKNMTDVMSFIICGSDDLVGIMFDMENDTQFFQLVKPFNIGRMPENEYDELVEAFNRQSGLVLDEVSKAELWRLTKGQVYYIKSVYNHIVDMFRDESTGRRCEVHLFDIFKTFEALYNNNNTFYGLESTFKGVNDEYTDEGKVISFIASKAAQPDKAVAYSRIYELSDSIDVAKMLKRLCARTFIEESPGRGYKFTSEMYRVAFRKSSPAELYFRRWEEAK